MDNTEREQLFFQRVVLHILEKHDAGCFEIADGCKKQDVERFIKVLRTWQEGRDKNECKAKQKSWW